MTITFDLDKGLDHAMATATSALDRHLERLTDQSWLRMIASGMDEGYGAGSARSDARGECPRARERTGGDSRDADEGVSPVIDGAISCCRAVPAPGRLNRPTVMRLGSVMRLES